MLTMICPKNNYSSQALITFFSGFNVCITYYVFSSSSLLFSASLIQNIREFGAKKHFTDHQTANTTQLFVPMKRKFQFFFRTSHREGEFPGGYLINIATCLFAYHQSRHQVVDRHLNSNVNEAIKTILNFFVFYEKILHTQKGIKSIKSTKSIKIAKTQTSK